MDKKLLIKTFKDIQQNLDQADKLVPAGSEANCQLENQIMSINYDIRAVKNNNNHALAIQIKAHQVMHDLASVHHYMDTHAAFSKSDN